MTAGHPFRIEHNGVVQFWVPPTADCPCQSGRPVSDCCLTKQGFRARAVGTAPPSPPTGVGRPGCYAANLCDCSSKLSREHFVSEGILQLLNREPPDDLRVGGFPWQGEGQEGRIPPKALASKILCDRHNSALAPVDSIALRLFQALDEENAAHSGQQLLHLFNGHDVERWLLKVLCGAAFSGNLPFRRETDTTVSPAWIKTLFGRADFEEGQGLYISRVPGERFDGPRGILCRGLARQGRLTGLAMHVCGYELVLSTVQLQNRELQGRKLAYRPMELYTTGPAFEKSVVFTWDGPADLGTISLSLGES